MWPSIISCSKSRRVHVIPFISFRKYTLYYSFSPILTDKGHNLGPVCTQERAVTAKNSQNIQLLLQSAIGILIKGGGIGKYFISVLQEQRKTQAVEAEFAENRNMPILIWPFLYPFSSFCSSKRWHKRICCVFLLDLCLQWMWTATQNSGRCHQSMETRLLRVADSHVSLELNYSSLGVALQISLVNTDTKSEPCWLRSFPLPQIKHGFAISITDPQLPSSFSHNCAT